MRRTRLAVGFAVLVSMLLAPRGGKYGVAGFGPFLGDEGFTKASGWYRGWWGVGIYYGSVGRVMIDMLALEIIFLAVLFGLAVAQRRAAKFGANFDSF